MRRFPQPEVARNFHQSVERRFRKGENPCGAKAEIVTQHLVGISPPPVPVLLTWLNPGLAAVAFMASLISKMADSSEEEGAGEPPPLHGGAADFEATTMGGGAAAAAGDPDEATATAAGAEAEDGEDDDEAAAAAILLRRDSLSPS